MNCQNTFNKETGFTYWLNSNEGAIIESGFSSRGSGLRGQAGNYNNFKEGFIAGWQQNTAIRKQKTLHFTMNPITQQSVKHILDRWATP